MAEESIMIGGSSFDGIIKGWEAGDINLNTVPEDEEKLKKWLKCNLFVNQMFNDITYTNPDTGELVIKKKASDCAMEFVESLDKIVNTMMKTL